MPIFNIDVFYGVFSGSNDRLDQVPVEKCAVLHTVMSGSSGFYHRAVSR